MTAGTNPSPPRRARPAGACANFLTLAMLAAALLWQPAVAWAQSWQSLEAIRTAVRDFLIAQPAERRGELQVEVDVLDTRLRLTACPPQRLEAFLAPGTRLAGRMTVGVRCTAAAAWSLYIPVRVRRLGEVVVARRALAKGQILTPDDLALERRDLFALPGAPLAEPSRAVGQTVRQPLAAGTVLQPTMLVAPRLVRRGDLVTIQAEAGAVNVRASGIALADGAAGDRIRVRNALTKKVIQATVAAAGLVRIE